MKISNLKKMSQKQVNKFINKGLADVCEDLARYKKTTPEQAKQFLKYAGVFRKLSKIYNVK